MCGIAGYICKEEKSDIKNIIEEMLSIIVHRGPDGEGVYVYNGRVALGHRRLSIIDLSEAGKQPMDYMGRYHVTFNGEIYNYQELRRELEKKKYTFATQTDTEVIPAAFHEWGKDCVRHFNGMWAFAIYDDKTNKLFCSRDRFGVKPFYYYYDENRLIFASEIKELIKVIGGQIKADIDHVSAYLCYGTIDYDDGTMFKGIKQLIGGNNLLVDCNELSLRFERYYDLKKEQNNNSRKENERLFREYFINSVKLRMRSDVPLGSCLSGGLDSSAIVCTVNKFRNKENNDNKGQITISSCFEEKKYDEQEYIDEVLSKTGIKGYKIFPEMDILFDKLDRIIWHMDEPFGSTSVYAQWCVFEEAKKQGLTVMLDGQGSDEQLAGYTPFYNVLFIDLMKKGKWKKLKREVKAYKELRANSESSSFVEIILSALTSFLFPDWIRYRLNRIYRNKVSGLPFPKSMYQKKQNKIYYKLYNKRDSRQFIYAGMNCGIRGLLHYEDRNSMAHSIESRVPFLDYNLADFIYSVPLEHKIVNGRTKNLIREGLRDILPETIYNRISKLGFVTPEEKWLMENEVFIYKELEKACDRLKKIIDKEQVLAWYKKHLHSTRMGDSTCFRIICCAHWADVFGVEFN